jgi:hypothetical protein
MDEKPKPKNPVTPEDKSRIMSTQSKNSEDGNTPKGSFPARAQAASDKNTAAGGTTE